MTEQLIILAIDPGPETSGAVLMSWYDERLEIEWAEPEEENDSLVGYIRSALPERAVLAIETFSPMGMGLGESSMQTLFQVGRFYGNAERKGRRICVVPRKEIKLALCGTMQATDANIRAALIDRFGGIGGKEKAVGTKKAPGPLYGVKSHAWQALAVGIVVLDRILSTQEP